MKPWKTFLLVCMLLVPSIPARGRQLPADAPSRQQVQSLFEAIQLRKTMESAQEVAMQSAVNTVQQMMRQSGVIPDAAMQREMDALMKGVMEDVRAVLPIEEMLEAVIPIYQRHFTSEEVNAIIAFQTSPVGKKVVSLQPAMMQESLQALTPLQQRAMPDLMKRLNERMRKVLPAAPPPAPATTPRN